MPRLSLLLLAFLVGTPAFAQGTLTVLYESEPGTDLSVMLDSATVGFDQRTDLNLDGAPDLTTLRDGEPAPDVVTYDVASGEVLWEFPLADVTDALGPTVRFVGFFTFAEGDPRHAVFRSPGALGIIAILIGKRADVTVLPARRAATLDLTGDGLAEVVTQNPETNTVQVYGGATNTATAAEIEAALAPFLASYPNPFHDRATITFDVGEAGPVTLAIYDVRGRRVRTLLDGALPAGPHRAAWDGRDDAGRAVASGLYVYRLRVGEAVVSRQAIRLR